MNRKLLNTLVLSAFALLGTQAMAAEPTAQLTRADVQAELARVNASGDRVDDLTGKKLNELYPEQYPAKAATVGKTRAQVQAELAQAQASGDLVSPITGQKLNEMYPAQYPATAAAHKAPTAAAGH